jgi:single-stranded-DNA-specific exonuclease
MVLTGTRYRWELESADAGVVEAVRSTGGISETFARVLATRGVDSADAAARYLSAAEDPLPDPHLLPDADAVVDRVRRALDGSELIAVHGHDDADGVTATTIMVEALDQLGARLTSYIPDRKTEGHGLSRAELDRLASAGVDLIITVDSCVSDREFIAYALELGMDTIVTDHHEIPPVLPPAVAIVNPKLPGSPFPYRYMAGVGVSLRVADLLLDELLPDHGPARECAPWCGTRWREEALAITAIGSIADRVPLTGDNRSLVTQGLAAIPATERVGLRVALEEGKLWGRELDPGDVRESLGPLLGRAPGDEPGSQRALDLLMERDPGVARSIAEALFRRQESWRETATTAWRRAKGQFDREVGGGTRPVVVMETDVPIGVVGYVASRLTEETGRPVILLAPRDSELMAEARGPVGFNFVDAFSSMRELFIGYGGHPRAAGFSIDPAKASEFRSRMEAYAAANPPAPPPRRLDAELAIEDATAELGRELELMGPFGQSNGRALFLARGVTAETVALAEERGVRFGTPMRAGSTPTDMVFRLRDSDGVALVSVVDSFPTVPSIPEVGE